MLLRWIHLKQASVYSCSRCILLAALVSLYCHSPACLSAAEAVKDTPTWTPPVQWMLEPSAVPDSNATTEAEMKPYTETIPGSDAKFEMVPIPGGKFLMGSPTDEEDRVEDEGPQVEVQISPFWMGKHEVTWDEYELWAMGLHKQRRQVLGQESTKYDELADAITIPTKPYQDMTFGMGRDRRPAVCMTQLAAKMYCKWLSAKTGRYYRLPTEAEWEYACRAGTTTAYSFGDDAADLDDYAWYFDNSDESYQEIGQKKANAWGLHDIHGNVAEWVLGTYSEEGYGQLGPGPLKDPVQVPKKIYPRIVRGGSWLDDPEMLRSAARVTSSSDWKAQDPQLPQSIWYHTDADFVGIRVVRPLTKPSLEEADQYDLDAAQEESMTEYSEIKGAIQ